MQHSRRGFCRALTDQKDGANGLLAILAPNLMVKPATVMFKKVTIRNEKQAVQMFGPAQRGIVLQRALFLKKRSRIFLLEWVFILVHAPIWMSVYKTGITKRQNKRLKMLSIRNQPLTSCLLNIKTLSILLRRNIKLTVSLKR